MDTIDTPGEELAARAPVRPDSPTFTDLGVRPETVEALAAVGITRAFAIQEYALPIALRGADIIGQAPTGTGKTLGFGVPILQRVLAPSEGADGLPQALVVLPTRELGLQVAKDLQTAGRTRGVRVLSIYGGVAYEPQIDALNKGVDVVVGTPGRLLDLIKGKHLKLHQVSVLVLDEADRMLDLGFQEDVEKILAKLPGERQTMLFSATMPDPIVAMSRKYLRNPVTIHAGHTDESKASPLTKQLVYRAHPLNKTEVVARILQARDRGLTMVFCRTKRAAQQVADDLDFRGFAAGAVHGDLGQGARERALRAFRTGKVDVLIATDVAARGLDVTGVTHVINYDCPEDADAYTHRIGRTGRAGATGVAVTFVDWEDMPRWRLIEKTLGLEITGPGREPPETYHTSAHLYADLDIPEGVGGTLPVAERTRAGLHAEVEEDLSGGPRSPRGRGGRRGRGGGDRPAAGAPAGDQPAAPRQRRRRRLADESTPSAGPADSAGSGHAAGRADAPGSANAGGSGATGSANAAGSAGAAGTTAENTAEPAVPARSRRRRRRPADADNPGTESAARTEAPTGEDGQPARPRRRRTRRSAGSTPAEPA